MVRFVVARHEENSLKLPELLRKKSKTFILVRDDVTYVAKQSKVGCLSLDFEDVVGFGGFEMKVREYLDLHDRRIGKVWRKESEPRSRSSDIQVSRELIDIAIGLGILSDARLSVDF